MPLISLEYRIFVEGETSITATDIISFEIILTYDLISDENQGPGFVHAENYPFLKMANWYMVICDAQTKDHVIQMALLKPEAGSNKIKFEMKQKLGKAGNYQFQCYVCNDSFIGFDKQLLMKVTVEKEDKTRVVQDYDDADQELIAEAKRNAHVEESSNANDSSNREEPDANQLLEEAGLKQPSRKELRADKKKKR